MNSDGARVWYIPDGYLPTPLEREPIYKNHESICIINATEQDAHLRVDVYFADRDPAEGIAITIPAKRCLHVRTDDPAQFGGYQMPYDVPYGARIRSDVPIVVQYSRMYTTTRNISLMTAMAYAAEA